MELETLAKTVAADVGSILVQVRELRDLRRFSLGRAIGEALSAAISFIIALALNEAFLRTFKLIPLGNSLWGVWIYALFALVVGILLLCLINWVLQPALTQLFGKRVAAGPKPEPEPSTATPNA